MKPDLPALPPGFAPADPPGITAPAALPPPDLATLQTLFDAVPARVSMIDAAHRFVYLNHEALAFVRLPIEQVVGRHLSEVLGEAAYQSYLPVAERLFAGQSLQREGWIEYRGHIRRYVKESLVPYAPGGGPVLGVVAFVRDLTELRQREIDLAARLADLQTTEALKAAIVDNALSAIVLADEDGRIVEFNPAAEQAFGFRREEAVGRLVSDVIIPHHYREAHLDGMARMKSGGPARVIGKRVEMNALRADGSEFPVEMVLSRTVVDGRTFYSAFLVDLSERRRAEDEINRQREALRQSEKLTAMGSLLAGVAHELNNPLAIVMGRASLLEAKCTDPRLQADVVRIREAAERCGRIVRTFLSMARKKPSERTDVCLNDLVRGAVDLLQYNLRTSGIEVTLQLAPQLPTVRADADQLGQVVLNLLVNAQQALTQPNAPVRPPLRVRVESGVLPGSGGATGQVWLRVCDNGPGVAEVHRQRIFDPFFTTKPEGAGTGLGLAVSRSVAREHAGELALDTAPSPLGGACFLLSLPITAAAPATPEPREAPAPADVLTARVLVVDDEAELADVIREMLEVAQFEVATAESGEVALELLSEARFDAVVSDLRMPGMDGPGLWRAIQAQHPQLARRIVFVTGDTLSAGAREFLRQTGCACIEKPFTAEELTSRVSAIVEGRL